MEETFLYYTILHLLYWGWLTDIQYFIKGQ